MNDESADMANTNLATNDRQAGRQGLCNMATRNCRNANQDGRVHAGSILAILDWVDAENRQRSRRGDGKKHERTVCMHRRFR
jgi:hypothetical protein